MPLWSNEDWRARIGSCWCALGRTFNTRFTRCRGKSQRDLSPHQATTMVIMMILFIVANIGLYVTRERHKNLICVLIGETITELHLIRFGLLVTLFVPVLKFVVQMVSSQLPRKLKMSLKNVFIDLNDGLWFIGSVIRTFLVSPVLFVVNFTTGNRLSNGILMRSLVVVVIVTNQLLVLVVDARAIIYLLSRDIEQNRGPGHIDYFVTKELLVKAETTAVQASLLLRCGDVESNPGPLTREGGVNQDVERNMNKVVKSGQITDSDRMFKDLALVIHDKFMEIGLELGLEYQTVCNELEVMKKGSDKAMKMLQLWKQSIIRDNFTYSVLAAALEKHGHKQAAHKFCYTEASSNLQSNTQQYVETREAPTVNSGDNPPPTVASVAPTVNMPHGYHNYQSPHSSGSFVDHPPVHMHMDNQPSLSSHLHNQGVAPTVNVPHGQHNHQSPHPSSSFMLSPPAHMPMYDQPPFSPHLHNQGILPKVNTPHGQHNHQSPHPSSGLMLPPPVHVPMYHQPSFSPHLHNQGYSAIPPNQAYTWPHRRGDFAHLAYNNVMAPTISTMYAYTQGQPQYVQGAPPIQSPPSNWTPQPGQSQDGGVPEPKRRKPDPSEPPLGQVPLSTHHLQHMNRWRQLLVDSYLAQEHSTDAWPPLKIVKFLKLALVKEDEQAYHLGLKTVQKDIDAVYGQKSNASYENLFQNINNGSLVLFEGRPGSGKTTLMVRASCDWGRANIFESKLVIFVRLRHLNKSRDVYLHDLLRIACPAFTPEDVQGLSSYIEGRLGENVVFLLDGFDEYAPGASDENYISKLILKTVYSRSIIILSSRPAATQRFRQNTTVWIEVVGFMKEQVLQYINCYFERNKEKSSSLIKHLEEHDNLMNLCYLPLHCAMLVFLYNIDATLPKTETEFYRDFTLSLLIRRIRKDIKLKPLHKLKSFDSLPGEKIEAFNKIGKLAFEATVAHRQVFEESEVHGICFSDSSENTSEDLGLVVVDRYFAKCGIDETYTFLHLTLQEYLAALFVSRLSESEQISTMATLFSHQHLFVTSRFLFGILDYSKENTKILFKQMLDATKDHILHHIQCVCESHSASACTDVVNFHDKNLSFQSISNSSDIFYIAHVLKTFEFDAIELSFSECNFDSNDAVSLLQGVGDCQLSLIIKEGKAARSMLNALSRVTVSGLVELFVAYKEKFAISDLYQTMGPNHLKHSTNLRKLELIGIDISNSGLEEAFKFWPNLMKLKLDRCLCHVSSVAEVLGEGLQHMTKAHHTTDQTLDITLQDCDFNKEAAVGLLQAVGDRRLSLTIRYEDMGIDAAQPLVDALCLVTLPGLIELNVRFGYDDYEYLTMRPNNLKHSTYLQKLKLNWLDISNSGLEKALKHWPNLVELDLELCKIAASKAVVLGESLQHTSKLQTLKLIGTDISNGLVEGVKHLPNLVELDLDCCHIDASTAVALGESLQHTSKLQTLGLCVNPIGDDGLHALSLLIKNYCKELKELEFWDTQLTDRSITCLTEWIKVLNNLEKLNLKLNHFSEGGVKQIEEAVSERNTREDVAKLKLDISDQFHVPYH